MYCSKCGTELSSEAAFCWKCGEPKERPKSAEVAKWDVCEVELVMEFAKYEDGIFAGFNAFLGDLIGKDKDAKNRYKWVAKAVGSHGIYLAGESAEISHSQLASAEKVVENLVAQLVKQGWEPTGKGEKWYSFKFRRRTR